MGKQQKLKEHRKRASETALQLEKIGFPFPTWLQGVPNGDVLIRLYLQLAGVFVKPLADSVTPQTLREGVHGLLLALDDLLRTIPREIQFEGHTEKSVLACAKGCNHCCTIRVTTTAPTIIALAHYLRKKLSAEDLADVISKMERHVLEGEALSPLEQVLNSRMCPLNLGGACIGYEYRPCGCRTYHSFDAQRCKAEMEDPSKETNVPQDAQRLSFQSLVVEAMDTCMNRMGLLGHELEFIPALLIALTEENAADRYIRGEDVFAPAHRPDVLEAQERDLRRRGLFTLPQSLS